MPRSGSSGLHGVNPNYKGEKKENDFFEVAVQAVRLFT